MTDPFERKAALYLMKDEERALIGVGDDAVRKVLGIPKTSPPMTNLGGAPDFLSVTKGNKLALSEAKGGSNFAGDAVSQLENAMKKVKELGLETDIDRLEIITKKGATLGNNYGVKDGYLTTIAPDGSSGHKTVHIDGFPLLFIKVVEI